MKEYKRLYGIEWRKNNPEKLKEHYKKRREKDKEYYEQNKEKRISQAKASYEKNRDKVLKRGRERHLRIKYNLSSEQYLDMVVSQENCCAICGKPEHRLLKTGDIKPLSVDHNHVTNEVRELLCNDCNALLGFAKENVNVLQNSIKYLQKHTK
jgi:galactose-1-phosphate uridylyltransferase